MDDTIRVPDEEPLYDPDRMTFEDLDITNPDAINAYLNHPVTEALNEDLSREFRRKPAAEQRRVIESGLSEKDAMCGEVTQSMERLDPDDPARASLQRLLDGLHDYIDMAKLRLLELDDED